MNFLCPPRTKPSSACIMILFRSMAVHQSIFYHRMTFPGRKKPPGAHMRRPQKVRLFGVGTHILLTVFLFKFQKCLVSPEHRCMADLHQRRNEPQGPSPEPVHQRQGFIGFHGHADTFFQCFVEICPDIPDHRILIDVHSALLMEPTTAFSSSLTKVLEWIKPGRYS